LGLDAGDVVGEVSDQVATELGNGVGGCDGGEELGGVR